MSATPGLTEGIALRFSRIALGHARREYPNKPGHVLAGPEDARTPAALHPVFYGSYDWHSCVHSYWMLARLLREFPAMETAGEIQALFDAQLVADKIAGECAYMTAPEARGYERPYGWGWLLKLSAELRLLPETRWANELQPLADIFAQRFRDFLPLATYPVRVGTHFNTALALRLAADYASSTGDSELMSLFEQTATRWYGLDEDCPAWGEPSGDDFLSSALIEAECMRRLNAPENFAVWFDRFFPRLDRALPAPIFNPATVSDRSDGKIAHLDGLNLSRAWCWRSLSLTLGKDDPRRAILQAAAERHLNAALAEVLEGGDYMGEHWLASFATLALETR